MPSPLVASEQKVLQHFSRVSDRLVSQVDTTAQPQVIADWDIVPLVGGLVGKGCERTSRNRGADVSVTPLVHINDGLWAWIGYVEEWDEEPSAGRTRRFSFRNVGVTVHFGFKSDLHKPQMFRAEWAGFARWNGSSDWTFQAEGAGHPHWQFDALESLQGDDTSKKAQDLLEILQSEIEEAEPRDFVPQPLEQNDVEELLSLQQLSRIHFASAASWWNNSSEQPHIQAPKSLNDIETWVDKTIQYISQELVRLR